MLEEFKSYLVLFVFSYFLISYVFIKKKEYLVEKYREKLFQKTDERFSVFQTIINEFKNPSDYEITFLNEVIKIRTQSQKYFNENRFKECFSSEVKINKIVESIESLINEYQQFDIISNEKKQKYVIQLKELNIEIEKETKSYNNFVQNYNKTKVNTMFSFFMLLSGSLFKKAELFNLK